MRSKQTQSFGARAWREVSRVAAAALIFLCVTGCASTSAASAAPAVEISERVDVGDARLYVEIRGKDADAPLMIWLHGGPGGAQRPLFRYFNSDLERSFLVAYLDQRGAGRSFDPDAPSTRLTIAQHVADLDRVVDRLRRQFRRDRVLLVGHSWGTVLGALYAEAHPEKISGLVSVAPVVSFSEQQAREYAYDLGEATSRDDQPALTELRGIGPPPYGAPDRLIRLQRVTDRYRGVEFQSHNHGLIVVNGMRRGLITPWELVRIIHGLHRSLAAMHAELAGFDMRRQVRRLEVPVFVFLGRHDRHTDAALAYEYFERLSAPRKEFFWFEQSAHDIPFDEPQLFNARVVQAARSLAQ